MMDGNVERMGEIRNANKVIVGKAEGKRQLETNYVDGRTILNWY
jgi:hypothetical protein